MVTKVLGSVLALSCFVVGLATTGCAASSDDTSNNGAVVNDAPELNERATVHFASTGTWDARWEGSLREGGSLAIDYDFNRLPQCRNQGRVVSWVIEVSYRFDGGEVTTTALDGSPGAPETMPKSGIQIPHGAHSIELWFENRAVGGYDSCTAWDSAYGANYTHSIE